MPIKNIAIIGAGPAGLRAAEVCAEAGNKVTLFDSKPSAGRKFLVAGKSGLNLTNDENWKLFLEKYIGEQLPTPHWKNILTEFDNQDLRNWADELGINTFVASSGKVFPSKMKAAPLLRRWIEKLRRLNINFEFNHNLTEINNHGDIIHLNFLNNRESITLHYDSVILALGGASWPRTGSTGQWVNLLNKHNIGITPLTAANCGWEITWSNHLLHEAEGSPLKNIVVTAGKKSIGGELVITKYGLEGGPLYKLGSFIKALPSPEIHIDFKPNHSPSQLFRKMESARESTKGNLIKEAKLRWKLNPAAAALLKDRFSNDETHTTEKLVHTIKHFHLSLVQPRPIDEVISSAGGIKWSELDEHLMLKSLPNVYCAGEMIDWEAPTGGYLLQACFATGNWVGKWLSQS